MLKNNMFLAAANYLSNKSQLSLMKIWKLYVKGLTELLFYFNQYSTTDITLSLYVR